MLDADTRMVVSLDYVTDNPPERNTEMVPPIGCMLHWRILIVPLIVKLRNYSTLGGSGQDGS